MVLATTECEQRPNADDTHSVRLAMAGITTDEAAPGLPGAASSYPIQLWSVIQVIFWAATRLPRWTWLTDYGWKTRVCELE